MYVSFVNLVAHSFILHFYTEGAFVRKGFLSEELMPLGRGLGCVYATPVTADLAIIEDIVSAGHG